MHKLAQQTIDVVVVGAGQAGLAAGYYLHRAGLRFVILEAGPQPAGSWPRYYDSLRLFSPAQYASLPGLPFPAAPDHYPSRDEVVSYFARYAEHFDLPVETNMPVRRVEQSDGVFTLMTDGAMVEAWSVIAATGSFHRPYLPDIRGMATFGGRILHSAAYHTPDEFHGGRVVVVGGGNSAIQIAVELAQHAHVTLASRKPLRFTPQRIMGRDMHWWSDKVGVERIPFGRWFGLREATPVLDTGTYRAALAQGLPPWRPMFRAFNPEGVVWQDGTAEQVDAVIFATGFRPNLDYLQPLGALAADGRPQHKAGISTTTPGLGYVGLAAQRTLASSTLRGVGADARFVVEQLRHFLRKREHVQR